MRTAVLPESLLVCSTGVAGAASEEDAHMEHFALYQHATRPEWGFAIAIDYLVDRRIFLFESGERRAIMNEYAHLISQVEPAAELATKARQALRKFAVRAMAAPMAKKKTAARKTAPSLGVEGSSRRAAAKARPR